jgi:hypothetical protein
MGMVANMRAQYRNIATGPGADMVAGIPKAFTLPDPGVQTDLPDATPAVAHASAMPDALLADPVPGAAAELGFSYPTPEPLPVMQILEAPGMSAHKDVPEYLMAAIERHGMPTKFAVNMEDLTPAKQAAVLAMNQSRATPTWLVNYKSMFVWGYDTLLPAVLIDRCVHMNKFTNAKLECFNT